MSATEGGWGFEKCWQSLTRGGGGSSKCWQSWQRGGGWSGKCWQSLTRGDKLHVARVIPYYYHHGLQTKLFFLFKINIFWYFSCQKTPKTWERGGVAKCWHRWQRGRGSKPHADNHWLFLTIFYRFQLFLAVSNHLTIFNCFPPFQLLRKNLNFFQLFLLCLTLFFKTIFSHFQLLKTLFDFFSTVNRS